MDKSLLSLTFSIFEYCGFWRWRRVNDNDDRYAYYDLYTLLVLVTIFTFTLSLLLDAVLQVQSFDEFAGNAFVLFTFISSGGKGINVLLRHKDIRGMLRTLSSESCRPRNEVEISIRRSFDQSIKSFTIWYMTLVEITVCLIVLRPMFSGKRRHLPYRMWLPFDHTSSWTTHCLSYAHQVISAVIHSLIHVATESLVAGLMCQICGQLEILQERLRRITEHRSDYESQRTEMLVECIRSHVQVFQFAKTLNSAFKTTFFIQFTVTCMSLCSSIYLLAIINVLSIQFASLAFYVGCMLSQLLFYCWYGNEVITKSQNLSDALYQTNWCDLNVSEKKIIMNMMIRSAKPIKIIGASVLPLSVDTYMLKISYSAFNFLQRSIVS